MMFFNQSVTQQCQQQFDQQQAPHIDFNNFYLSEELGCLWGMCFIVLYFNYMNINTFASSESIRDNSRHQHDAYKIFANNDKISTERVLP